jgi:histidinol phosphatase-like PHP family hydrolase
LDYPNDVLATVDFVVASVHSGFRRDRDEQTARILKAITNPFTILGHITGRLLLRRTGYDVDVERVLRGCAEHGVAVEVRAGRVRHPRTARPRPSCHARRALGIYPSRGPAADCCSPAMRVSAP